MDARLPEAFPDYALTHHTKTRRKLSELHATPRQRWECAD